MILTISLIEIAKALCCIIFSLGTNAEADEVAGHAEVESERVLLPTKTER